MNTRTGTITFDDVLDGDLVTFEMGGSVITGRVTDPDSADATVHLAAAIPDISFWDLYRAGFRITARKPRKLSLPTEPGVYRDSDGDFWALDPNVDTWRYLSNADGGYFAFDIEVAREALPFTLVGPAS